MMSSAGMGRSWLICSLGVIGGCALLSKSEPMVPRYFSPELQPRVVPLPVAERSLELRLGAVTSGSVIRQNLLYRDSEFELGYDEEHRWTEKPEVYLRRALSRALFEMRGIRRVISGPSTTLEVELIAFEEIRKTGNRVRATLSFVLHDERVVRMEETFTLEQPVSVGDEAQHLDAVVQASSAVLEAVVNHIADRVSGQLEGRERGKPLPVGASN